jgi:peptidyl-prolyl cis-trans isomerase C
MMRMRLRGLAVALLLVCGPPAHAGPLPKEAAASVNGVVVPRKALLDVVQAVIAQLDDLPDTATTEKYRRQALDSLIDFELLYQDGQARNLTVTPGDIATEVKQTEKSFPSPKAYQEALKSKGLTTADIERETRRALIVRRMLQDVVWPGVTASEEEIRRYYDQHKAEFEHPAQIRVSYILIPAKKDAAARAKGRSAAAALAGRARAGEDFAALARSESKDPATAQKGGDLGYIGRGTMGDAFDQAAFALAPGQVSEPIETPFGFVVIKMVSSRPAGVASIEEVRERIAVVIKGEGREKAQEKFVAGLRSKAAIDIAPDLR